MAQYLDKTGLTTLWAKIKNTFALKSHTHSKSEVGLGNVDNTSDADKPVSNATQQALNLKANANDVYTKSETDNKINEPLYNLGAYDTISGNVITRQTGYLDGKDYLSKTINRNGVNNPYIKIDNIHVDYIENIIGNCNRVDTNSWWNFTFSNVTISYDSTYKFLVIMLPNDSTNTSSLNNIYIQYKLATVTTEKVEKNHYARYNQRFILEHNKSEAERSANLFDKDNVAVGDINANDGEFREINTDFMASDYIEIKPNTTYSNNLKIKSFGTTGLAFYDINKTYISGIINNYSAYNKFTTPSNAKYLRLSIDISYSQPYDDINNLMLNEGTTPLPYQSYEGKTIHEKNIIDLYENAYNLGYYDTISENSDGTYTITRQTGYVDLGSLSWELVNGVFKAQLLGALNIHGTYNVPHVLCAKYEAKNSDGTAPRIVGLWKDTSFENYIGIEDTTYSNATDFKASVAGVILQYELATSYTEKVEKNHYATYNQRFILEHNKSEAERSANLFNNPYNYSGTNNGVSINLVGNECILNGTSTNGYYNNLGSVTLKAGTYTFNQVILSGSVNGDINRIKFGLYKDGSLFPLGYATGTYTLTEDTSVGIVVWFGEAGITFNNCKLAYMLNEGSTALPYQPYSGKVIHKKDITDLYENAYNLGYYDTMVENSDGTYTITRQTGYLDLDKLHWIYDPNNNQFYSEEITSAYSESNTWIPVICNKYPYNIVDHNDLPTPHIRGFYDKRLYVVDETLNQNGELITGIIQYKLATSYTEKVEKNHYSRYNKTFILEHNKSEAERSANLGYFADRQGRWWVTKQDDISEFINQLPNGTYNISADVTPLSIDSGYNVTSCFFWLQIYGGQYSSGDGIKTVIDNFTSLNQTRRGYLTFTKQSYTNYEFRLWGFGNHNGGNHGEGKCSNIMLVEGDHSYPYQPYEGKVVHEKELESAKNEINNSKQDKLVSNTNIKTINGNSILGSGDMAITADSVFTEVTDVIDTFTINRNGTWLITCLGYNKIYASDNSSIFFYGSALVSMTSAGSDPHICINGTAYACSSAITFITSGIMQVYKKAN